MRTRYSHLSDAELVQVHRWDAQSCALMEELWNRLENTLAEQPLPTRSQALWQQRLKAE